MKYCCFYLFTLSFFSPKRYAHGLIILTNTHSFNTKSDILTWRSTVPLKRTSAICSLYSMDFSPTALSSSICGELQLSKCQMQHGNKLSHFANE